ncbi:MAG: transposase, partial [Patescibacteria group bacterium]
MQNRDYKNFSAESIFHIYNRGNNREKIFMNDQDRKSFLLRLGLCLGFTKEELDKDGETHIPKSRIQITKTEKGNFKLIAFCLMPNHFHLLIEQTGDMPISNLLLKLCTSYSRYFNKTHNRVGHVFQDQFKSVLIENNEQLMWT